MDTKNLFAIRIIISFLCALTFLGLGKCPEKVDTNEFLSENDPEDLAIIIRARAHNDFISISHKIQPINNSDNYLSLSGSSEYWKIENTIESYRTSDRSSSLSYKSGDTIFIELHILELGHVFSGYLPTAEILSLSDFNIDTNYNVSFSWTPTPNEYSSFTSNVYCSSLDGGKRSASARGGSFFANNGVVGDSSTGDDWRAIGQIEFNANQYLDSAITNSSQCTASLTFYQELHGSHSFNKLGTASLIWKDDENARDTAYFVSK